MAVPSRNSYVHRVASEAQLQSSIADNFRSRILCPESFCYRNAVEPPSTRFKHEVSITLASMNEKIKRQQTYLSRGVSYDDYFLQEWETYSRQFLDKRALIQPIDFVDFELQFLSRDVIFGQMPYRPQLDENSLFRSPRAREIEVFRSQTARIHLRNSYRLDFVDLFKNK